jgi:hypothetical protein
LRDLIMDSRPDVRVEWRRRGSQVKNATMSKRPFLNRQTVQRIAIILVSGAIFIGSAAAAGVAASMLLTEYMWR